MESIPYYRKALKQAFEQRVERNPRYSLRAFASYLKIDSSVCSQLLSGKRVPSVLVADRLIQKLNLDALERDAFLQSLGKTKLKQGLTRMNPALRKIARSKRDSSAHTRQDLSIDAFQAISRWYYYAILELTKLPKFQDHPKWIAAELGLSQAEAQYALERLLELGMLERKGGKLRKSAESFYSADPHLTSAGHKRRQKEILNKSIDALENDPITLRSHSAMTVAIDPKLIPEAKKKISTFLQELSDFLESNGAKQVYEIHVGLFSLQTPTHTNPTYKET